MKYVVMIRVIFGLLGWLLFIGSTFQIQKVEVFPRSGNSYMQTRLIPPWSSSRSFDLKEDGQYSIRIFYVYGLYEYAGFAGGASSSSHSE
jgi:hypothetical protein